MEYACFHIFPLIEDQNNPRERERQRDRGGWIAWWLNTISGVECSLLLYSPKNLKDSFGK